MPLPELYLIGAPKAGTTSVASRLARHSEVFWSTPKEPFYWAADYPRLRSHYGFDTRRDYEGLFSSTAARRARWRGDGSTTYLYSDAAVPEILETKPQARFVVCLRNPVDLLVSYHRTQLTALNEDEEDFGRAWHRSMQHDLPGVTPLDPKLVDYPLVGRLGAAMERLYSLVPRSRVHVIMFDDLVRAPRRVWSALTDFLDVDDELVPDVGPLNASNKMVRSRALRRLTHRPPRALEPTMRGLRHWSRNTSMPGVAAVKRRMWQQADRPSASEQVRCSVHEYLDDDIRLLSDLVGQDLVTWAPAGSTR